MPSPGETHDPDGSPGAAGAPPAPAEGPSTGRHRLGPHLVGERVVVRHLLADGRATDSLGVCTSIGPEHLEVDTDRGPVRIAMDAVVTGKPVPPRASVRDRVSAREAELHGLETWPNLDVLELGSWVLRSDRGPSERLFKRANSVLAMDDPGMPFDEAEAQVRRFYGLRGRPLLAQVGQDSAEEGAFVRAGWRPVGTGDTTFEVHSLGAVARGLPTPPDGATVTEDGPRVLVELTEDGETVARGRAVFHDDWLGVHGLATAPTHRRRGLARQVMAELVDWGGALGAGTVWLHVETDNHPAREFYRRLGFRPHHSCRYLTRD